ncbi:hypothetical protein [Burkholderia gladioli]|uniref:hypothetical protein n=1 Tax=Burkholderia gladioli TaxID=28095 RepID=UPI00285B57E1|nr:hypothetical protein [Burkholderia gladioli]MDR8091074.1 hypothetical protein [Burkholderia gladioli]
MFGKGVTVYLFQAAGDHTVRAMKLKTAGLGVAHHGEGPQRIVISFSASDVTDDFIRADGVGDNIVEIANVELAMATARQFAHQLKAHKLRMVAAQVAQGTNTQAELDRLTAIDPGVIMQL